MEMCVKHVQNIPQGAATKQFFLIPHPCELCATPTAHYEETHLIEVAIVANLRAQLPLLQVAIAM